MVWANRPTVERPRRAWRRASDPLNEHTASPLVMSTYSDKALAPYRTALALLAIAGLAACGDDDTSSPDGGRGTPAGPILFTSYRDGDAEIYAMNADGTNQLRLTRSPGEDLFARWSPNGST